MSIRVVYEDESTKVIVVKDDNGNLWCTRTLRYGQGGELVNSIAVYADGSVYRNLLQQ